MTTVATSMKRPATTSSIARVETVSPTPSWTNSSGSWLMPKPPALRHLRENEDAPSRTARNVLASSVGGDEARFGHQVLVQFAGFGHPGGVFVAAHERLG